MTHDNEQKIRTMLNQSNHIVVKIGSSSIADPEHGLYQHRIDSFVDAIAARIHRNTSVVLVSSGAIASGLPILGIKKRPHELSYLQAAASVGQMTLAGAWAASFARYNLTVGQILLTVHDVAYRNHYVNAVRTFERLRSLGVIPVVNENDTLATHEIRFGDNDRLAALIAHLSGATGLFLFSDIDALYDNDPTEPNTQRISLIAHTTPHITFGKRSTVGTGGMESKLHAGLLAANSGIPVLMTSAALASVALESASVGTVFAPAHKRLSARKFWVRSIAEAQGSITVDDGAAEAITRHRKSLLISGITEVSGDFYLGDVVEIHDHNGTVLAHGITNYDKTEILETLEILKTLTTIDDSQQKTTLGRVKHGTSYQPIVHANDLVRVEYAHKNTATPPLSEDQL